MAKQFEFGTHEEYVEAQLFYTRRKARQNRRCFACEHVIDAIREHHKTPVKFGVCHGVRRGLELARFEARFPDAKWLGTEITPELCDGKQVLNFDFADPPDEWLDSVDLIYSNSFDHSRHPHEVAAAWVSCLSETGRMYVEWSPWHGKLGKGSNKADCFAATAEEYADVFNGVGSVEKEIKIKEHSAKHKYTRSIFAVAKKSTG